MSSPDLATINNLGWQLLAKTNISQPHVSVPTFAAELKDLPMLVKDWGGSLLRKIAKGHLTWRWAVAPMISDLKKLCDFSSGFYQRTLMLSLLQQQRSARRRAGLGGSSFSTTPTNVILSSGQGAIINAKRGFQVDQTIWGSVKWKLDPAVVIPFRDDRKLDWIANRLTFGITSHEALAALWEITPWSWFIDWFAGIGTMIAATNNTVPCTWAENCVMVHTTSKAVWTNVTGIAPWMSLSGTPTEEFDRKERFLAAPFLPYVPSFQPLATPKAWSILASLYALKRFRR
jgi:hypothetical protein